MAEYRSKLKAKMDKTIHDVLNILFESLFVFKRKWPINLAPPVLL